MADKAPADLNTLKKSRASLTGALTKLSDKVKAIKSDEAATIAAISITDVQQILKSLNRTENKIQISMEHGQIFCPQDEGYEPYQEREEDILDNFDTSINLIRVQATQRLQLYNTLAGLKDLRRDIKAIEASLSTDAGGDNTSALHLLEICYSKLSVEWREANLPPGHALKSELDASSSTITDLAARVARARAGPASLPSPSPVSSASHRMDRDRTKLPAIALPTFKGDILQWPTFWQKFSAAVDMHDDLPDSTKLCYLRTAIQDPEAEIILNPSMDGPSTYKRLVKELHQRYERTKKIHRELVEKLINLPPAKHNSKDLRRLIDSTTSCIECLESTGLFTLETFLSSMIYSKLPYKLQIDWDNDHSVENTVLPYPKLLEYVSKKAFTLSDHKSSTTSNTVEPSERKTPKNKPQQKQKSYVHSVTPTPAASTLTRPPYKWECALCRPEKHPLHLCSKWMSYTLAQRLDHVKLKNLCSNCLAVGHTTASCKSVYRCRDCQQTHHTSLHQIPSAPVHSTVVQSKQVPDALLMTAEVLLKGPSGHQVKARAFIDPGAGMSLISKRLTQILDLTLEPNKINFTGVQGTPCKGSKYLTSLTISPTFSNQEIKCRPAVVQHVTEDMPTRPLTPAHEFHHLVGLQLADPNFHIPARIDILLGAELWLQLQAPSPSIVASVSEPGAQATIFGWAITGAAVYQDTNTPVVHTHHLQQTQTISWEEHAEIVHSFWLSEQTCPPKELLSKTEEYVEKHYKEHVVYSAADCCYQVAIPKDQKCPPLGQSRPQAVYRFYSNERSNMRKGVDKDFNDQVQGYINMEHAEKVPPEEINLPHYYLPMHSVTKSSSTSTKLRVVFDGSASTSTGISLNKMLLPGPTIQPTLGNTLLKFRTYPIALTADIAKMYRGVKLAPNDKDLHRFIWRPDPTQPLQDYRMTRVTFGVSSSPFLAIRTLHQIAEDHGGDYPAAKDHILHSFYVDDFLAGAASEEEALQLYTDVRSILKLGGFNLCKWRSSSMTVIRNIPENLLEKIPVKDLTDLHTTSYPKALGLEWDSRTDTMSPSINISPTYISTKRGIISDVSKTFDILGWISPTILTMKLLYQHIWEKGHEWDETVPDNLAKQHSKWREELPCLATKQLPRCYSLQGHTPLTQELHGFSDASLRAYGAVVYVRTTYQSHPPTLSLVTAKTKVTKRKNPPKKKIPTESPVKENKEVKEDLLTVPKLELCGAVLLTKLLKQVTSALNTPTISIHAWTDSSIVLGWLGKQPRELEQFVANRVATILKSTDPSNWKHVPTADNPADCASRGVNPAELLHHTLWWNGPSWLHHDPVQVPAQPARKTQLPAVRAIHALVVKTDISLLMAARTTNYHTLIGITAWCLRFYGRLKRGRPHPENRGKRLTGEELQAAEHWLWSHSQSRSFPSERTALLKHKPTAPCSRLRALNPIMGEDGLIRVGGRVHHSSLTPSQQYPVILDSKDSLLKTLFQHRHVSLGHCGPSLLLSSTGDRLHVMGARKLSRNICTQCIKCKRAAPRPVPQMMAGLPIERTTPSQPTFTNTGIDFAGPFTLKLGHVRRPVKIKAYICVFVCMSTKAVHLEVTSDLTTETFIPCLKRFIARRNCPTSIFSDSGPNFVGAHNKLNNVYKFLAEEKTESAINQYLLQHKITWNHSPARAPTFGGLWESAVKSMKRHLKRIMGTLMFTFEELNTIACEVEACLNSRPLLPMTSHNQDGLCTLTAGHFLLLDAPRAYPEDPRMPEKRRLLTKWNQCQYVVKHFWTRWSKEYLHTLQSRTKWQQGKPNICCGDIVIYKDEKSLANRWPLARVIRTYPGPDNRVRVIKIQTGTTIYKRPVTKVSLLFRPDAPQASPLDSQAAEASPGSMSRQKPDTAGSD